MGKEPKSGEQQQLPECFPMKQDKGVGEPGARLDELVVRFSTARLQDKTEGGKKEEKKTN